MVGKICKMVGFKLRVKVEGATDDKTGE